MWVLGRQETTLYISSIFIFVAAWAACHLMNWPEMASKYASFRVANQLQSTGGGWLVDWANAEQKSCRRMKARVLVGGGKLILERFELTQNDSLLHLLMKHTLEG